jgi:hypothetical protein
MHRHYAASCCRSVAQLIFIIEVDSAARQWGITDIQRWAVSSTDQGGGMRRTIKPGSFGFLTLSGVRNSNPPPPLASPLALSDF